MTLRSPIEGTCGHCGAIHFGSGTCPRIKAIEYHPNGAIKRIEYRDPTPSPHAVTN